MTTVKEISSDFDNFIKADEDEDLPKEEDKNQWQCPTVDPSKTQIILLVVGTVRSFIYPTMHEYYYQNQVKILESSNAQVHQIWYFSLSEVTKKIFPPANVTHLQHLQSLYNASVLTLYDATNLTLPEEFEQNPYHRNCSGVHFHNIASQYAQSYHLQSAFKVAMEYAKSCNVDWSFVIRSR